MTSVTSKLYILQYDFVENTVEKRKTYREAHLAHVGKQVDKGNVILGGPVGHPLTGSLGIFCNLTSDDIEEIVQQDPFVINGIVAKYTIKPYIAVAGDPLLKDDLVKV